MAISAKSSFVTRKSLSIRFLKYWVPEAGEMAQQWRACSAFAENPGWTPSTHVEPNNHLWLPFQRIPHLLLVSVTTAYTWYKQSCKRKSHKQKINRSLKLNIWIPILKPSLIKAQAPWNSLELLYISVTLVTVVINIKKKGAGIDFVSCCSVSTSLSRTLCWWLVRITEEVIHII